MALTGDANDRRPATVYRAESIQRIDDNLFLVVGVAIVNRVARINRNMVVLRHNKKELTLVNPIRLEIEDENRLLKLGGIQRIIRLAPRHGVAHDRYYLEKFPSIRRWAPSMSNDDDVPVHRVISEDDDALLPACHVFCFHRTSEPECALVILQDYVGNLLVTSDSLQAHRDNPFINMPMRTKMAASGLMAADVVAPPAWLKQMSAERRGHRQALREDFESLLRLDFERLVGASGVMVHQNAEEKVVLAVEHAFPNW